MIVDDHALIRESWAKFIGGYPEYEVVFITGDGQQAIDAARDKRPDIVLLDINMIPISGFEVLEMVRRLSPGSKVIGVSMHSQPAYVKKMMRGGAKGYVTKSSPTEELMQAIAEVSVGRTYICAEVKTIIADLAVNDNPQGQSLISQLSERELEIIRLVRNGLSSKEIAEELSITPKTVEVHRHNILKKLKLKNSVALIEFMNNHGL
jgi:two-component system, NarL family, invasion response regulator UvrY